MSNGTHVVDENNLQFPLYKDESNQSFAITEYLCGREYYGSKMEYRWLQRFNGTAMQGMETWSLSNVSIVYFESGIQCFSNLTESVFLDYNGSQLESAHWVMPSCEKESPQTLNVYFNEASLMHGLTERSVILRPFWWNALCLQRVMKGLYNMIFSYIIS